MEEQTLLQMFLKEQEEKSKAELILDDLVDNVNKDIFNGNLKFDNKK